MKSATSPIHDNKAMKANLELPTVNQEAEQQDNVLLSPATARKRVQFPSQRHSLDDALLSSATARKSVQFPSQRPSLESHRSISRLSSRTLQEIHAVWENEEEELARKQKLRYDLDRVAGVLTGGDGDDEKYWNWGNCSDPCILGLDDKVGDRAEEKAQHRQNAWDAVMWEQHNQWEEHNNCDYDVVAKVYSEGARTGEVQRRAQEVARRLEIEMQAWRDEPEVMELLSQSNHSVDSSQEGYPRSCMSASNSVNCDDSERTSHSMNYFKDSERYVRP
jgi:hypothetical protein